MPNIILPNLAPLNASTKQRLITIADTYTRSHFNNVLHYLQTGEITIEEMPLLDRVPDLKAKLQTSYDKWLNAPDPQEESDWNDVRTQIPDAFDQLSEADSERLCNLLKLYIDKYTRQGSPKCNHVEEARSLSRRLAAVVVNNEWNGVDQLDYNSLIRFYNKHTGNIPDNILNQLDDALWDLVYSDSGFVDLSKVSKFLNDFPVSPNHLAAAKKIVSSVSDWEDVKRSNDVYKVNEYMKSHPDSPFTEEAEKQLYILGKQYLEDFKRVMGSKTLHDYREVLDKGVFEEQDFIDAGIVTKKVLKTLEKVDSGTLRTIVDHTDTRTENLQCPQGKTDVYLFGVPSTGKTCVIMGLLNSLLLDWDASLYGGKAGLQLQQLCREGYVPEATKFELATVITGNIIDESGQYKHPINIVDMSGEEFAKKIANNPNAKVSFADMGKGIPELLNNDNEKLFFLIVDPINEYIHIREEDESGNYVRKELSQYAVFHQFCSILTNPENANIMSRVKAIHFIATKADMLSDDREQRLEIAVSRCRDLYGHSINKLTDLCDSRNFNINPGTDNKPMVFTFSLGHFYLGNAYEYDKTDSDALIRIIASMSSGEAAYESVWRKFVKWLNK